MTDVTLTRDQQIRIRFAMFHMPFAGSHVAVPVPPSPVNTPLEADAILAFLEGLAGVLRNHGDDYTALEKAHSQLTGDVAAFRRILGTR